VQATCYYDLALPDSDEELDDEVAAIFAGSEVSGLSGAAPDVSGVSAASDAGAASGEVASSPPKDEDRDCVSHPEAAKRQRQPQDEAAAGESPSEGSTGAAEQRAAETCVAAEKERAAQDASQKAHPVDSEPCMSTPEAPPVAVNGPAASVASDARDSFAGNALAALAAAECATAESQLTPLPSQADAPSQTPEAEAGTSPRHDVAGASKPLTCSPAAPAAAGISYAVAPAAGAADVSAADAVQTAGGDAARLMPVIKKMKSSAAGGAQPLGPRKPWK
jgi:hypothetical protein